MEIPGVSHFLDLVRSEVEVDEAKNLQSVSVSRVFCVWAGVFTFKGKTITALFLIGLYKIMSLRVHKSPLGWLAHLQAMMVRQWDWLMKPKDWVHWYKYGMILSPCPPPFFPRVVIDGGTVTMGTVSQCGMDMVMMVYHITGQLPSLQRGCICKSCNDKWSCIRFPGDWWPPPSPDPTTVH